MVIVRLHGGLANQMFPYAAGRRLSLVLGTQLKLDIAGFSIYHERGEIDFRQYGLSVFNIEESFASPDEIAKLTTVRQGKLSSFVHRLFHNKPKRPKSYVREKHIYFDPDILILQDDVYLDGNWNSWHYFADIESIIRSDFTFKNPATGENRIFLEKIRSCESASLHVRRGDYANDAKTNSIHGTCSLDYYQRAIHFIADRVKDPHFFVFSDDLNWVRDNLRISFPCTFVDCNGPLDGHEDMRLMSQCKHNVIANSGFSWWSAWLNPYHEKIVVAPRKWFKSSKYQMYTPVPDGYVKL